MLEDGQLKLRLGPELARKLKRLCKHTGLKPEDWVRHSINTEGGKLDQIGPSRPPEPRSEAIPPEHD